MVAFGIVLVVALLLVILLFNRQEYSKTPQFIHCNRPCQRRLYQALWKAGYYPEVGFKVGQYEIDIAFPYRKVAIECTWNHQDYTDILYYRSKKKKQLLREQGWKVVSFSPNEIHRNPKECIWKIEQSFRAAQPNYGPKKQK